MLTIGREIAGTFLESSSTRSSSIERTFSLSFFLRDELQATAHQRRFTLACFGLELVKDLSIVLGQPGVNICLHSATVAQFVSCVLQQGHEHRQRSESSTCSRRTPAPTWISSLAAGGRWCLGNHIDNRRSQAQRRTPACVAAERRGPFLQPNMSRLRTANSRYAAS